MAKAGLIADQGETVRADSIQIALMQGEFGLAIRTALGILGPRRPARRASHHLGLVPLRLLHNDHVTAVTPKPAPNRSPAGIILALTFRAGYEEAHAAILNGPPFFASRCPGRMLCLFTRSAFSYGKRRFRQLLACTKPEGSHGLLRNRPNALYSAVDAGLVRRRHEQTLAH